MQKFKTMAKLKLKTVQNGTEVENPNLMESGSYDYVDCSGYVIIGSGVYDNSGNLVEEGQLIIDAGSNELRIGTSPCLQLDVSWDSGIIDLPIGGEVSSSGWQPCVTVTHDDPILFCGITVYFDEEFHHYDTLIETTDLKFEWGTPLYTHFHFNYLLEDEHRHLYRGTAYGTFHLPCRYEPPQNNNDE